MHDDNRIFFKTKPLTAKSTARPYYYQEGKNLGRALGAANEDSGSQLNTQRAPVNGVAGEMSQYAPKVGPGSGES